MCCQQNANSFTDAVTIMSIFTFHVKTWIVFKIYSGKPYHDKTMSNNQTTALASFTRIQFSAVMNIKV